MSTFPSLYNPKDAERGYYAPRIKDFVEEAQKSRRVISKSFRRNTLVLIDCQHDFVDPTGSLSVPGAQQDIRRIVEFIYNNLDDITAIYVSLDSHRSMHIFFPNWWKYVYNNAYPEPFTAIMPEPDSGGRAVDSEGEVLYPTRDEQWSLEYLWKMHPEPLVLWPYHTQIGTLGHTLVPALCEALAYWSVKTMRDVNYVIKGMCPQVEQFGIFAADVAYPDDPSTFLQVALLEKMWPDFTNLYFAGQAKSHCVLASLRQAVNYHPKTKTHFLHFIEDASSSVVHPTIDFDLLAERELEQLEQQGLRRVRSTEKIS